MVPTGVEVMLWRSGVCGSPAWALPFAPAPVQLLQALRGLPGHPHQVQELIVPALAAVSAPGLRLQIGAGTHKADALVMVTANAHPGCPSSLLPRLAGPVGLREPSCRAPPGSRLEERGSHAAPSSGAEPPTCPGSIWGPLQIAQCWTSWNRAGVVLGHPPSPDTCAPLLAPLLSMPETSLVPLHLA